MSEQGQFEADLEVFKVVVEHFRHNLEIFWQHYVLFIAIQGALLTVAADASDRRRHILVIFGILLSAFWLLIGWSRWKLIDLWREEVKCLDHEVDRRQAFYWVETKVRSSPLGIPAFLSLILPLLVGSGWVFLWSGN